MTILDKIKNESSNPKNPIVQHEEDSSRTELPQIAAKFNEMMEQFKVNTGFSVNTNTEAVDTMVEILSSKDVMVSLSVLLSYVRYCVNRGIKKDITVKIGYNKPPSCPMNFAINEEMIEEIYPGDTIEIN